MKNSTQTKFNVARVPKRHENDLSRVKDAIRKAAALFVFAMLVACATTPAMAAGLVKITDIQGGGGASKGVDSKYVAKSPDRTIYFGNYWQNPRNMTSSSDVSDYDKEGIKWRVLANNTETDGNGNKGVLLLSDQGLYADAFDYTSPYTNVWKASEIRATLTGLESETSSTGVTYDNLNDDSFAHDAFNAKEYAAIADTTHKAGGNPDYDHESTDKLFLLSEEEAQNIDYGFSSNPDIIVASTALAANVQMYNNSGKCCSGAAWWWLRSPGDYDGGAYYVFNDGYVYVYNYVYDDGGAARVAFNLNQESVLFLSAAVGGKTSVAVGNGFTLSDDYTGDKGWKVTLKDNGIAAPTGVTVAQAYTGYKTVDELAAATLAGETMDLTNGVTMSYNNAPIVTYKANAIGVTANYVSAVIVSGDKYINYAKISSADKETAKEVPFGDLGDGRYTMYIFAEAASGDKQTDYASDFGTGIDGVTTEFTIHKGSSTVNEGKLSKEYKDKDLTVKLGGGFDLGFEKDTYATKIIVVKGADDNKLRGGVSDDAEPTGLMAAINTVFDTEKPDDTDFTTLKELVTVEKEAKLACFNKIKFMNLEVNGDLTIEDDAVVDLYEAKIGGGSTISIQNTGTLINHSEEKITVWDISKGKSVQVESRYYYTPSSMDKPEPLEEKPSKGGSSSGCNAGFGIAMLLSAAAAMLRKRKRG